jgi:hypothetical protein
VVVVLEVAVRPFTVVVVDGVDVGPCEATSFEEQPATRPATDSAPTTIQLVRRDRCMCVSLPQEPPDRSG